MFEINIARTKHKSYHAKIVEYMGFFLSECSNLYVYFLSRQSQEIRKENPGQEFMLPLLSWSPCWFCLLL